MSGLRLEKPLHATAREGDSDPTHFAVDARFEADPEMTARVA